MEHFDDTGTILQKVEEIILSKNLIELLLSFLHVQIVFLKVLENWQSVIKIYHVSNNVIYKNI